MSSNFFYKDGKGNIVGENGNEAMDFEVEFDPYNLGILFTLTQYRSSRNRFLAEPTEELDVRMEEAAEAVTSRKYNVYTDKHKAVFYYFNRVKLWKTVPFVLQCSAVKQVAQCRTSKYYDSNNSRTE